MKFDMPMIQFQNSKEVYQKKKKKRYCNTNTILNKNI